MQTVSDSRPATDTTADAIVVRGLGKEYGRRRVLDDVSLTVGVGEVFGFLGPNGAGKTTTVKILMGLVYPTSGDATIMGIPIGDIAARRHVGYLPENFRFHGWMTGNDLLDFHGRLAGLSADERRVRGPEVLEQVGLSGRGEDKIRGYSKGMSQRIGIAQAMLSRPEIVFLDEPTSALDPVGRREVRDLIHELRSEGTTVFLNSHLLTEIEMVCDRVAIVDHGRVVRSGALRDLVDGAPELTLRFDRVDDDLLAALRSHGEIISVEGTELTLGISDLGAAGAVAEAVVQAGYGLLAMIPKQKSLEEVFMSSVESQGE